MVISLKDAGLCMVRMSTARIYATYHPGSPAGISHCYVCRRLVFRGLGRWWEEVWPCAANR